MNDKPSNEIEIIPASLCGNVTIPPSKSMSHRAVIGASLAAGQSRIDNVILSDDIKATIAGMRVFGANIQAQRAPKFEITSEKKIGTNAADRLFLSIRGFDYLSAVRENIHCRESGSTLRFLLPIGALTGEKITFTGEGKLIERPLTEYYNIFERDEVFYENCGGRLPLTIHGRLKGGAYCLRGDVSSQFISGLMMALPLLDNHSEIILTTPLESASYVRMTINMLSLFGIKMQHLKPDRYMIDGGQRYRPLDYRVEGDFSQAAFWLVAGAISKADGGFLQCDDIGMDSLQGDKQIVSLLKKMGARIEAPSQSSLRIYPGELGAIDVDASDIPDIIPVLSVAMAVSAGKSVIYNAGRLRLKESDRLQAIVTELGKLGADIRAVGDEIHIRGKENLLGGRVYSWQDHRIAMAMAVASVACKNTVILSGANAVTKSYPHFFRDFKRLGGKYHGR